MHDHAVLQDVRGGSSAGRDRGEEAPANAPQCAARRGRHPCVDGWQMRVATRRSRLASGQCAQRCCPPPAAVPCRSVGRHKRELAEMCVKAVLAVADLERKDVNLDLIKVRDIAVPQRNTLYRLLRRLSCAGAVWMREGGRQRVQQQLDDGPGPCAPPCERDCHPLRFQPAPASPLRRVAACSWTERWAGGWRTPSWCMASCWTRR